MGDMRIKKKHLKYVAIILMVVFLIAAGLMLLELWERGRDDFAASDAQDGVVTYNGQQYVRKETVETFLVLGLDKYAGADASDSHGSGVQADFLMLFVFDNETKQCTALHINRETMTDVNQLSIGGTAVVATYTKQIALAYNYVEDDNDKIRCGNTKNSVETLLHGAKVNHYLSLTMDFVPAINDLVGGVEVTVLDDFSGIDSTLVKGEKVTLMGEQALRYVRTRYGLEDSTNSTRMVRQQQYINALYDKVVSRMAADEAFVYDLVQMTDAYLVYDSSDQKMQKFAEKFGEYEFLGIREIEGESRPGAEFMEFYPDEDALWEVVTDLFYVPKKSEK